MTDSGDVLIGAVDQGTSSTRFLVFNSKTSELLTYHQVELEHKLPKEGWVQMDPDAILDSVYKCIDKAVENLQGMKIDPRKIKSIGITNQRETTVAWDKSTGKPLHDAIVWLDIRTVDTVKKLVSKTPNNDKDYLRPRCGLPITTYFSAVKMRWLADNIDGVASALKSDSCLFGTVDSWLVWNMTGGLNGGKFITDVTNASRTMLMNIKTLAWDQELCSFFELPMSALPDIKSSAEVYGHVTEGSLKGMPIAGILGDQQAALVGQSCFQIGQAKNTYGTGCFMLYNTGSEAVNSTRGLLTTVAYKLGPDDPVCYALEGSVAIGGACVRWLRDNLGIIKTSEEIESLASEVDSTHDCYFVPAFSGLFCPYWHSDARGIICGLTQFTNKAHIARAALEAVAFQSRELLDAMNADSGIPITSLKVDGGMTNNNLMMQIQADMLGIGVVKPAMSETTALGAAMAAGKTIGAWNMGATSSAVTTTTFTPGIGSEERELRYARWKKAVAKSMNWA